MAAGTAVASGDIEAPWIAIPVAVSAAVIGALYGRLMRRTGGNPRLRSMPSSLRRVLIGYWAVAAIIIGPTLIWALTSDAPWAHTRAGIVVALVAGGDGTVADRIYQYRARRLAASAGIERG